MSGCQSGDLASFAGHYEGFSVAGNSTQSSIAADVAVNGESLTMKLATEPATTETDFTVALSNGSASLTSSSGFFQGSLALAPGKGGCFQGGANNFCYSSNEITFSINGTKFVLDKMAQPQISREMETPKVYTIDELMTRAQNRSFTSEVEFQTVVQDKLTATTAYRNLLPHINVGSAADIYGFVPTSMIRAIGDLLPFFLPNRWFQAAAEKDAATAEFDSYRVVQASAMNVVHGLALSVLCNEQALQTMEVNRMKITQIRDEVLSAEQSGAGNTQIGASENVNIVLNALVTSIDAMQETLNEELTALSQAAGFNNPLAVSGVEPIAVTAVSGPLAGTLDSLSQAAVSRSLALLQIDDLVSSAKDTKDANYFQWLDFSGNDSASLGLGFTTNIAVSDATIQGLYDKKAETQAQLLTTIQNAITDSQEVFQDFQLATQASAMNQTLINSGLMSFRSGLQFEMQSLVTALSGKTAGDINQVNAQYAYLTQQAQIDYLTYSGPYAALLSEKYDPKQ